MKRALPSALLAISLVAAACSSPTDVEVAQASESDFGPVMEDVAVSETTTTIAQPSSAADDEEVPDEIAFEDEVEADAGVGGIQLPSSDVGVCAAMDDVLDLFFDATQFTPLQDELSSGGRIEALLMELDDGPFGAEWNAFWLAFVEADRTGNDSGLAAFDDVWLQNADQLATEQCGYPVIQTFITAIRPNCFDAVGEDVEPGAVTCTPQPDPR